MKSKFPPPEEADITPELGDCQSIDRHMSDTCPSDGGHMTDNSQSINDSEPGTSLNKGSTENDSHMTDICQSIDRHMSALNPNPKSNPKTEVLSVQLSKQNSKSSNSVSDKPKQTTHQIRLADEEFLTQLRATGAYNGIDLDAELRKMRAWLLTPKGRGRKLTRQFVVNWLNKVDRPLQFGGNLERSPPKRAKL